MEAKLQNFVSAAPANARPDTQGSVEQVAVLVCHGMGQQVPFETIDGVARLLRKEVRRDAEMAGRPLGSDEPEITTRIVAQDGYKLGRAELRYSKPDGSGTVDVHVYEAYWAPLTAGKVSIGDVYKFLKDAGISGMDKACASFRRYMFEDWQLFKVPFIGTFLEFLVVLGLFLSLALMSVTIVAVGATRSLTHGEMGWPTDGLMVDLTCDLILFGSVAAVLGIFYWWAGRRERARNQSNEPVAIRNGMGLLNFLILIGLVLAVVAALATGALFLIHLSMGRDDATAPWWQGRVADFFSNPSSQSATAMAVIWLAVLYINERVRQFFVEYLGDVAAYIAPHTAHKFYEIRQAIQKAARDAARAVYSMRSAEKGGLLYDRIVVMGHSLGSVVAYDVINALMLDDATDSANSVGVHDRTRHLITFGSPLDKTAFIFREQQQANSQVREALAANVQPLIRDYRNRQNLTWVNLWSRYDPISGRLDFYDAHPPEKRPQNARLVENRHDHYCNIPLYAHTMYWESPNLGKVMLSAVRG